MSPWGRIFIDGRAYGATPLPPVDLKPGPHTVLVVNEELHAERMFTVRMEPGKDDELKVRLDE